MRTRQYRVSAAEVTRWAVTTWVEALGWSTARTRLGPVRLVQLLIRAAAALRLTVERCPSGTTWIFLPICGECGTEWRKGPL